MTYLVFFFYHFLLFLIAALIFDNFFQRKSVKVSLLFAVFSSFVLSYLEFIKIQENLLPFISIIFLFCFLALCFQADLFSVFSFACFFVAVFFLCELFFSSLFDGLSGAQGFVTALLKAQKKTRILFLLAFRFMVLIPCGLIRRRQRIFPMGGWQKAAVTFFSLAVIFGDLFIRSAFLQKDQQKAVLTVVLTFFVLMILFFITGIVLFFAIQKEAEKRLLSARIEQYEDYVEEIKENYQTIAKINHDFKKHLRVLSQLMENDQFQKSSLYLKEIEEDFDRIRPMAFTGVVVVDAVLASYFHQAKKRGIDIDIQARFQKDCKISHKDLSAVLFNLLDNAIEACEKAEEKEPFIYLNLGVKNGFLVIRCLNSAPFEEEKTDFSTTKSDKSAHGYGMGIIASLAKKYGGTAGFVQRKNCFEATVEMRI